jgi:hypothetical protein
LPRAGKYLAATPRVFYIRPSVSDSDGSQPGHTISQPRRILANCAAFLGALVLCSAAAGPWLPFPPVGGPYQKWLYLQQHRASIDVLFLGSSRFHRQIIPARFDAKVAALSGKRVRSFNFGIDGMWPPESYWVLRRILLSRPPALRWVVLEGMAIDARLDADNAGSHRLTYWHDWRHTKMAWRSVLELPLPAREKVPILCGHAWHFAAASLHCGRGAEWIAHEITSEPRRRTDRWRPPRGWRDLEGYEPMPDKALTPKERTAFLAAVARRRAGLKPLEDTANFRKALREITDETKAAGIQPIIVVPPSLRQFGSISDPPAKIPVWRFLDPDEYSALYDPDLYADFAHLNPKGADLFTDLLAARFAEMLSNQP